MQPSAAAGRTQRQLEACHSKFTHKTLGDAKNYSRQLERLRCCQRCRSENANADQVKAGGKAGQGICLGAEYVLQSKGYLRGALLHRLCKVARLISVMALRRPLSDVKAHKL